MRYIFNFPDIGEGLDEGTIAEWYIEKGQTIKSGDPIVKMETDKVVTDIPTPKSGVVVARYGGEGETINVGDPLVEIEIEGVEGEGAQIESKKSDVQPIEEEEGAGVVGTLEVAGNNAIMSASEEGVTETKAETSKTKKKKAIATPVARAMARELGIDINEVPGTGPGGRVMTDDIKKYHSSAASYSKPTYTVEGTPVERVTYEPLSQIRKTIAKNMLASKQNAPHMTVHDEVEISELVNVRARYKSRFAEEGVKLSYLPFILKAVAQGLKKYKSLNSQMDMENDRMIFKNYYNIGIAVDTPKGLVVPVIRDVDKKSIKELANDVNSIIEKSRSGSLTMEDMKDGSFTITNYGSIGGIYANPVINYPQAAILGIGRIVTKPVFDENDELKKGQVLPLSLAVDHRIVDGGDVARFLNQVIQYLGDPVSLLMD